MKEPTFLQQKKIRFLLNFVHFLSTEGKVRFFSAPVDVVAVHESRFINNDRGAFHYTGTGVNSAAVRVDRCVISMRSLQQKRVLFKMQVLCRLKWTSYLWKLEHEHARHAHARTQCAGECALYKNRLKRGVYEHPIINLKHLIS